MWRKRLGDKLELVLQESLKVAHSTGALKPKDMARVTVDTTVQPKNITYPTDAKLMHRAIEKLGALAKRHGVVLRQSYVRVAKIALIMAGRYGHAKQYKRQNRQVRFLRTRLGRLMRDIRRKIEGNEMLERLFADPLSKAERIRGQHKQQNGPKLYAWHAKEVECIGKGKPHKPYEFGVKVSITTTNRRCKGGMFVLHAATCPGRPHDSKTLQAVIEGTQQITGRPVERIYVDKGYQGHDYPNKTRVFRSGQKRGVHGQIKKELRRRSAIEAVIGHLKNKGHMGRNFLKGRHGDTANAVLTAAGYNFRLILKWLTTLWSLLLIWKSTYATKTVAEKMTY